MLTCGQAFDHCMWAPKPRFKSHLLLHRFLFTPSSSIPLEIQPLAERAWRLSYYCTTCAMTIKLGSRDQKAVQFISSVGQLELKHQLLTLSKTAAEVTGCLAVKTLDYGSRGCGFESHHLLPRKGFFSRVSGFLRCLGKLGLEKRENLLHHTKIPRRVCGAFVCQQIWYRCL